MQLIIVFRFAKKFCCIKSSIDITVPPTSSNKLALQILRKLVSTILIGLDTSHLAFGFSFEPIVTSFQFSQ